MNDDREPVRPKRFHGRVPGAAPHCAVPGCPEPGEFRAPLTPGGPDGPGRWQWLCLDHVRAFNARYNYFAGMRADEISAAQTPYGGWERETRAFARAGVDSPPKWADFADPLDAISAGFRRNMPPTRPDGRTITAADNGALKTLGLDAQADRRAIRSAYSTLVRKFHPDRNGGDRSHEKKLQAVIAAYQQLKSSPAFN